MFVCWRDRLAYERDPWPQNIKDGTSGPVLLTEGYYAVPVPVFGNRADSRQRSFACSTPGCTTTFTTGSAVLSCKKAELSRANMFPLASQLSTVRAPLPLCVPADVLGCSCCSAKTYSILSFKGSALHLDHLQGRLCAECANWAFSRLLLRPTTSRR